MGDWKPTRAPRRSAELSETRAEEAIVADCLDYLRGLPRCHARKVHGSRYQDKGEPDIDGCLNGRALKVEVKMPGKTPTAIQGKRLRAWQEAGALAGCVTSEAELVELLLHVADMGWRDPSVPPRPQTI